MGSKSSVSMRGVVPSVCYSRRPFGRPLQLLRFQVDQIAHSNTFTGQRLTWRYLSPTIQITSYESHILCEYNAPLNRAAHLVNQSPVSYVSKSIMIPDLTHCCRISVVDSCRSRPRPYGSLLIAQLTTSPNILRVMQEIHSSVPFLVIMALTSMGSSQVQRLFH
jgi:hypothetical protein